MRRRKGLFERCLWSRGSEGVFCLQSIPVGGRSRGLGDGGWLGVRHPFSVFLAGSLLSVNEAELKESFTERGSAEGMRRMCLGSSNARDCGARWHSNG